MKVTEVIQQKIVDLPALQFRLAQWRLLNKTIAFTNGVFDILHEGHIYSLAAAAKEADYLIVGVNSDASVKKIKGSDRPVNNEQSRIVLLASLIMTDAIILFEEETPLQLIKAIMPDVLIKGGDYKPEDIAGAKEVMANGGRVVINEIIQGFSTTGIIQKIKQ